MNKKSNVSIFQFLIIFVMMGSYSMGYGQDEDLVKQQEVIKKKANDFVYSANELLNEDQFVSAEKEFRKAISTEEGNVAGNYNLANSYFGIGSYDEALFRQTEAAKAASTKSQKHRAYHNIGNILMKKKMCKEAVEAFKNALRNDPTDDESRYNFAIAKECADQQKDQQNDENDKDKEENKEDEKDGNNDKKEEDKDKDDEDKKEGDENKDGKNQPEDDKQDQKDGQDKQEKPQQPKPQPGQLSPQQIKSLLEAMNIQEQKVQEKLNAEKQKGVKVNTEKDW